MIKKTILLISGLFVIQNAVAKFDSNSYTCIGVGDTTVRKVEMTTNIETVYVQNDNSNVLEVNCTCNYSGPCFWNIDNFQYVNKGDSSGSIKSKNSKNLSWTLKDNRTSFALHLEFRES